MLNPPLGHDLLASARALLLDDLLPELPPGQERKIRMIADAMGIAERELHDSANAVSRELRVLAELYEEAPPPLPAPDDITEHLRSMNARLVRDIRSRNARSPQGRASAPRAPRAGALPVADREPDVPCARSGYG